MSDVTEARARIWGRILSALKEAGYTAHLGDGGWLVLNGKRFPGIGVTEVVPKYIGAKPTGKFRVVVGRYGDRATFNQTKRNNGDFDYTAIVQHIESVVHALDLRKTQQKSSQLQRAEYVRMRSSLLREFAGPPFREGEDPSTGEVWIVPERAVDTALEVDDQGLHLKFKRALTEQELRALLPVCKRLGLV